MVLNIGQAFKMAWRSICGKKGRSALTILSIFIGIAAVMTIVSTMEGMKAKTMEQFAAMGSNRITVSVYSWTYDEDGNQISKDYFTGLYKFCSALKDSIIGITPNSSSNATVVYGTKSTANMEWKYDEQYNVTSGPPQLYYGSDQYSACNNLAVAKGRDLAWLDCEKYNQICVLGAQAAKVFFGTANPVGQVMQVNGNSFEVVGVYGARVEPDTPSAYQTDNFIIFPYTATRLLGDAAPTDFLVKAKDDASMNTAISEIGGYLSGVVDQSIGDYEVQKENRWADYQNEQLTMISLVLGGIAAISLLVGGIGIMNIMLVTVTERTREIGIRRSLGAQRSSIVAQFLIESGMLCGMGGIVGIIFGTIGSLVLGKILFQMTIFPATWVTLAAFGLSVALGVLFGSYPAAKASKLQPVEALRADYRRENNEKTNFDLAAGDQHAGLPADGACRGGGCHQIFRCQRQLHRHRRGDPAAHGGAGRLWRRHLPAQRRADPGSVLQNGGLRHGRQQRAGAVLHRHHLPGREALPLGVRLHQYGGEEGDHLRLCRRQIQAQPDRDHRTGGDHSHAGPGL